jgi:anti-sigma28 factor (negative regulator of flagellin synthesis)
MKVNNDKTVTAVPGTGGVSAAKPVEKNAQGAVPADRVSTTEAQVVRQVEVARSNATGARAARLRDIENAVRSGSYKPSASRVAEEILAAAELDAKLRALLTK